MDSNDTTLNSMDVKKKRPTAICAAAGLSQSRHGMQIRLAPVTGRKLPSASNPLTATGAASCEGPAHQVCWGSTNSNGNTGREQKYKAIPVRKTV